MLVRRPRPRSGGPGRKPHAGFLTLEGDYWDSSEIFQRTGIKCSRRHGPGRLSVQCAYDVTVGVVERLRGTKRQSIPSRCTGKLMKSSIDVRRKRLPVEDAARIQTQSDIGLEQLRESQGFGGNPGGWNALLRVESVGKRRCASWKY